MIDSERYAPIVIAGAGPVGLVSALRLAQAGIETTLIEKDAALAEDLRASTFHPPTLEMLDELDLTAGLFERGLKSPTWQIRRHEDNEKAEFDLSVIRNDTRYPFRLQVEQHLLCKLALASAEQQSLIDIRLGTELVAFDQNDEHVELSLRDSDGNAAKLRARFLIAADGSRSTVRDQLNISFEGLTYPETTILATTTFPFEEHLPGLSNVNYVWYRHGTFSLLRLPDIWRVSLYAREEEKPEALLNPDAIEARLQEIVSHKDRFPVKEIRPYRIHQRIVEDYRHGRILLAGDAAHLNSPSGGMGMNGGIHDAVCLTDLLPAVLRGEASLDSLDLYTRRRQPAARRQILQQAHENRTRMQQRDPEYRAGELARLKAIAADPSQAREYLLRSSMISGLREAAAVT
jgi:3-(3-hydroxy-phenyl)propionate hydroxylase